MKVLRYYPRAWVGDGGITNSVRQVSAAMARAGADVSIGIDDATALRQHDAFRWVPIQHVGPRAFRQPVDLARHLDGVDVMVLHSAWTGHNARAGAIARSLGVPYVLEPRGAYDPAIFRRRRALKQTWWWGFERSLVHHAAAVHVFFESDIEPLRSVGYEGPVVIAPNGIAIPETARWDGGSGGYLLWIGRFDPEHKGLDLLLRAVALLPAEERPPVRLHGPDWAGGKLRVAQLVTELGLDATVALGDPVYGDMKWDLISRARAFSYPSRWEGFGNSAAEAVCTGVPTLVTPYPFGRWLAGRGAAIMADASPESLADGIRRVWSDEGQSAARVGSDLLREELTWDAVARDWLRQTEALLPVRVET